MVRRTGDHGSAASRRQHINPFFPNGLELRSWFNRKTPCTSGPAGMRFLKQIYIDFENNFLRWSWRYAVRRLTARTVAERRGNPNLFVTHRSKTVSLLVARPRHGRFAIETCSSAATNRQRLHFGTGNMPIILLERRSEPIWITYRTIRPSYHETMHRAQSACERSSRYQDCGIARGMAWVRFGISTTSTHRHECLAGEPGRD